MSIAGNNYYFNSLAVNLYLLDSTQNSTMVVVVVVHYEVRNTYY